MTDDEGGWMESIDAEPVMLGDMVWVPYAISNSGGSMFMYVPYWYLEENVLQFDDDDDDENPFRVK